MLKIIRVRSNFISIFKVKSRDMWKEVIALHQQGDVNADRFSKAVQMLKETDIRADFAMDLSEIRAKRATKKNSATFEDAAAPAFEADRPSSSHAVLQDTPVASGTATGSCKINVFTE